ncbi:MAG: aspartate carbamoyltransferase catalytic subunit [Opitutales bacterium]
MARLYHSDEISRAIGEMTRRIAERLGGESFVIVGIANGGILLGRRIAALLSEMLGRDVPFGVLNAQFHRDDIGSKPIPKAFMRTDIPFDINDSTVVLVDDVVGSGRTVRAAMNEIFDHGRPAKVELAVLCDRGSRGLPVEADYVGLRVTAAQDEIVLVRLDQQNPQNDNVSIGPGVPNPLQDLSGSEVECWTRKDLVGIEHLSREEIDLVHSLATSFKQTLDRRQKKLPSLRGKTVVNLFMEPSTRTRVAFEIAAKRLSADVITITEGASSIVKGETLKDTARNIEALNADMIVLRHKSAGAAQYLANILRVPVINAGDGAHGHPTQALLDTFTLREKLGQDLTGRKITILGDILFSRVARSNIWALKKLGAKVTLAGPNTLVPRQFEELGVEVVHDLRKALADADAVMLLRIQHERQTSTLFPSLKEYTASFGLNKMRAAWLKPGAIIMHPGPINRGVEIDPDLADSPQSVILEQVTNGIVCRMAVLYLCANAAAVLRANDGSNLR